MSDVKEIWTIQKLLQWSKQYFETHGMDSPQLDAQVLLGHVLGMRKIDLIIQGQRPLNADELAEYKKLIIRRAVDHEPIAYILGEKEFWSLPLEVTPDVLIPRPDTECLVERALEYLKAVHEGRKVPWPALEGASRITYEKIDAREEYYQAVEAAEAQKNGEITGESEEPAKFDSAGGSDTIALSGGTETIETAKNDLLDQNNTNNSVQKISDLAPSLLNPFKVLDIGTGSGAIALAIAKEAGDFSHVTAVDISPQALAIARKNAENLGLSVEFIQSDLFAKVTEAQFDLIVSNPPYITTDEMTQLSPEIRREPTIALEAGQDGLAVYRRLIPEAMRHLKTGGALMLEIGCSQQAAVTQLLESSGFSQVRMFRDYGGQPRVMVGMS